MNTPHTRKAKSRLGIPEGICVADVGADALHDLLLIPKDIRF